jgi:xanthine dehydrogenase YagS FAD-binding subunit
VAVGEFFRVPASASERETVLAANEVVTRISIPALGLANATYEIRQRQGLDWPLVTASVAFSREGGGGAPARRAQIVLGHVAPKPWSVPQAAALLEGQTPDEALAARVAEAAAQGARPLSKNAYKVRLVKTAVKRAVLAAAEQRERGPSPR